MDADAGGPIFEQVSALLDKHLAATQSLIDHCTFLTERNAALTREVEMLGDRVGLIHVQGLIRDNALGEQLEALDSRLTTVHKAALRALNLTTGGDRIA